MMTQTRNRQDQMLFHAPSTATSLRIYVVLKDDQSKKVSIIIRGSTKIQEVKRKIEHEYDQLLNIKIVVGMIQDKDGFTISNNSCIGDHVQTGSTIYVVPDKIDLTQKMHLSSDLHDNFLTLRFMTNSFCDKMLKTEIPKGLPLQDLLPEFLHLGFWYSNQQTMEGVAKILRVLCTDQAIELYFLKSESTKQKSLLLTLLEFWLKELDTQRQKQFLVVVLQLIERLSRAEGFTKMCKNHPLIGLLVKVSKDESVELIYQRLALKIISNMVGGRVKDTSNNSKSPGSRANSQPDYVPSFMGSGNTSSGQMSPDLQPTLEMIHSPNLEMRALGLQVFQSNSRSFAAELFSQKDCMKTLRLVVTAPLSKNNQRIINSFVQQLVKRVDRQRSTQMMHHNFLHSMNNIFQESNPSYHSRLQSLVMAIAQAGGYRGNVDQALLFVNNPYKTLQEIALRIVESTSESGHKAINRMISKHMKQLILACLDRQAPETCVISVLKIINNTLLDDECRIEMMALKGVEVLAKMLRHTHVQVQRLAAKGLLNISLSSRQNKIKTLSAIADFMEGMYKNRIDKVVQGYLETLLKRK